MLRYWVVILSHGFESRSFLCLFFGNQGSAVFDAPSYKDLKYLGSWRPLVKIFDLTALAKWDTETRSKSPAHVELPDHPNG